MNNTEREQWIDNDEGLYNWFCEWARGERIRRRPASKQAFIREHRAELDSLINRTLGREGSPRQTHTNPSTGRYDFSRPLY